MQTSTVLTLYILWVVNNEVAIPHHWKIHRQLTDPHSLIQVLEARVSEAETEKRITVEKRKKERNISMGGLGIGIPVSSCVAVEATFPSYVTANLHHLNIWADTKEPPQ